VGVAFGGSPGADAFTGRSVLQERLLARDGSVDG